ncbi:MAG: MotA/TolQ/ExbB proton channel family protein [Rhodoferax sp.]|nr:MotA/TolQ/ExbB proton channel family protein [Rhodoferax sp.]
MKSIWVLPHRGLVFGLALLAGCVFIGVCTVWLGTGQGGIILLDAATTTFPYPLTIQNVMHLFFFVGLGEFFVRWRVAEREFAFVAQRLLPEDGETVLQSQDMPALRRKTAGNFDGEHGFLPYLIDLCVLQFQASRSVDQTVTVLNSSLELIAHRVDLRYALARYIVWVIPTIGFIGTVVGIAFAMEQINPEQVDLKALTSSLGVAFYTTLVALVQSALLVLLMNLVQAHEERSVNEAGHYTLRNLINRLYVGKEQ